MAATRSSSSSSSWISLLLPNRQQQQIQQQQQQRRSGINVIERTVSYSVTTTANRRKTILALIGLACYFVVMCYRFVLSIRHASTRTTESHFKSSSSYKTNGKQVPKLTKIPNEQQQHIQKLIPKQEQKICHRGIHSIEQEEVRLVALDFDLTIVSVHTGGRWKKSSNELSNHVRYEVICLIDYCLEHDIAVAITTFSTQYSLILSVLNKSLYNYRRQRSDDDTTVIELPNISTTIPIFGGDRYVSTEDSVEGKQSQLLLAIQYHEQLRQKRQQDEDENDVLSPNSNNNNSNYYSIETTLLVDDDYDNIRIAREDGYRTIYYKTNQQEEANNDSSALDSLVIDDTKT